MSVTENIIEATKTLVISIGSGEDFKLTSAEGAQRDYTVSKESEILSAGSRVLLVPSGTYDGTQDLNFELQGVVSGNTSQKAGIYTDTLNFEAVLTSNYRIEYHMDGGTNNPSNPATYEKDSGDINLANPTKEGYTFDGWYLNEDYSGDAVSVIANGTEGSIDLYAKWSLTPYTISYNLEEGNNDSSNPSGYNLSQLPITLAAPTKAGYTFKGWTGSNGDTPETELTIPTNTTGNLSYTANWELNSYTISYNLNGGTAENLVTSYNATMLPFTLETPAKANYDFGGWYETEDFSDTAIDTISTNNIGNKTLYAKWTGKQYNITYHLDSGENNVNNPAAYVFNGGDVTLLEPTKDGYSFEGWYETLDFSGSPVTQIDAGSTGNKTFYAKWNLETYTINYVLDGGTNNVSNPNGYDTTTLPITLYEPTKAGATFAGWYETLDFSGNPLTQIDAGTTGNKTFYAKWNLDSYTITYELNGGSFNTTAVTSYTVDDLPLTLKNPTKDGYTFLGWYETSDFSGNPLTQIDAGTTGNKTFYAKWNLETHTIAYELDGGTTTNPISYTVDNLPLTLTNPTKDGYTFLGWYETSDFSGSPVTQIDAGTTVDKTFYAKWAVNSYTYNIVYKSSSDKQIGSETATYEYGTTNVINPKEFAGYSTPESQNVAWDSIKKTITFIYTPITYTINWELNGGNLNDQSVSYNIETPDYTLPIPTKEGYAFAGWFTTNDLSGTTVTKLVTGSTGDKMFCAKWDSGNLYNITLKYMDGLTPDSNIIVSSVNALPTPSRTGYTFNGWHTASEGIGNDFLDQNDFISDSTYKWTYNSVSGEWESTGNKGINSSVSVLRTVEFNAKSGEQLSFEWRSYAESSWDYAAWNIWDVKNSKWLSGASTWGTSHSDSTSGLTPTSGLATTKSNQSSSVYTTNTYTFTNDGTYQIYWTYIKDSSGSNGTDLAYVRNVNVPGQTVTILSETPVNELSDGLTLYAKWTPINYIITYDLNGGSIATVNPSSYTIETASFMLNNPTKTDYVFAGWYETADYSGSKATSVSKGSTGDKTFYAKWYDNYTITYVLNDGTLPSDAKTVYSSGSKYSLPTPTKSDYVFAGWYETEDFSGSKVTSIAAGTTGNKTFYAKWYDNYTITYVLNDGTLPSDAKTVYSNGSSYTLPIPTKTGYVFKGWYTTPGFSGFPVTRINAGTTGNKTFYGKWGEPTYKLKTGSDFNSLIPKPTKSIIFTDEVMPSSATPIDVDADGDGGVVAWYDGTTFKVSTQKAGQKVIFNADSSRMFQYKNNVRSIDFANADTSKVTNMKYMFFWAGEDATTFDLDLSGWDTSKVTDMSYMFKGAGFYATTFNLDLSGWNTSNVTNMSTMFREAGLNATTFSFDLSGWDTSSVTDMSNMFFLAGQNATTFDLDLSGWNTSSVTNMRSMFHGAGSKAITWSVGDLSGWDTSSVTDMPLMFYGAGKTATSWSIGDLSGWDTSKVTNMGSMFLEAGYSATTWSVGDISGWDTSSVTNIAEMFSNAGYNATTFNLDLSGWDTSKVTNMAYMFSNAGYNATTFNLDLSGWNTSSVTDMSGMFSSAGHNATTWSIGDLSGWDTSKVTDMSSMFGSYNYGGAGQNATTWSVGDISGWDTSKVTDMSYMFYWAGKNAISWSVGDISGWDTSSVTNMSKIFAGAGYSATTFNLDLSGWNTSKVTDMNSMFASAGYSATTFSIEGLSNWNTSSVTNMSSMFSNSGYNATTFNLDLSGWNTSSVTNMSGMFSSAGHNATTWSIRNISGWNTSKVTDMNSMFASAGYSATTFSFDLSGWDTSSVTDMSEMFREAGLNATTFSFDLSGWNTSRVTDMSYMFSDAGYNATNWSIGDISNWDTSKAGFMKGMFNQAGYGATYSLDLSGWNVNNVYSHGHSDFNYGVESKITPPIWVR